jgi:hypothetical protein
MDNSVSDSLKLLDLSTSNSSVDEDMGSVTQALANLAHDGILKLTLTEHAETILKRLQQLGYRVTLRRWHNGAWDIEVLGAETPSITDLRYFEAPEPMQKTLMACSQLTTDEVFLARLPKVPIMLFPHLEARGLHWQVHEEVDSSALLLIRKTA